MNSRRMLLRLLRLGLLSLLFVHQTRPALSIIEKSVKELIVERRSNFFDLFTIKMKTGRTCDAETCRSLGGESYFQRGQRSCECQCFYEPYTFLSSIQRCADTTEVRDFGGCAEYLNRHPLLSYNTNPPRQPVDLTTASSVTLSATQATNCTFNQTYSVHDYSGFQSRWRTISNRFFNLTMTSGNGRFNLNWKADRNGTLSGRIIRIPITCTNAAGSSSTPCFLIKAKGFVTYYAPTTPMVSSSSSSVMVSLSFSSSLSVISPVPPSLSPSIQTSSSSSSSSSPSSSSFLSLSSHLPLSSPILFTSSVLSPSPSLIGIASTRTLGVSHSVSSYLPSTQIQTAKLSTQATSPTGIPRQSSGAEVTPSKAITAVSSSAATSSGPSPGDTKKRTGGNDNGIVIGAAVGGALVLGILVLMSIVVWKRRKPGKNSDKQVKTVENPDHGNSGNEIQLEMPKGGTSPIAQEDQPTYQGLLNDNRQSNGATVYSSAEGNYDNCTVYQTLDKENPGPPVYLGLSKGLPEGAPTTGLPNSRHSTMPNPKLKPSAEGIPSSKANGTIGVPKSNSATGQPKRGPSVSQEPVYNVLDGPGTGPRTTAEPLYNVLEGHEYATPNVDPLYNVLEGPDSNRSVSKSGPNTTEEAVYNVLEGPDTTNGPTTKQGPENDAIYNVLEAPDSDKNSVVAQGRSGPGNEPLYSVLEEQVGDGSKQNAPNKSSSIGGVANPAYEQTLDFDASYAAVRRPGTRGESLYEPLRRPGQDLYQPLG